MSGKNNSADYKQMVR